MNVEERMELVERDTREIVTRDELREILDKSPSSYWGVAPTGTPHIGYYRAIQKQIDLINAGFKHKILIADIHAYLDDRKASWETKEERGKVYEICLKKLGLEDAEFVYGHEFQTGEDFILDLYRIIGLVTVPRATRAASEVCRMKNPKVSELVYPLMQVLDFVHLNVDVALGGTDQRHVYMLGREVLPKMGMKKPILVTHEPGLSTQASKMSASENSGKIVLWDDPEKIMKVIKKAYCPPGNEKNPILEYAKYLVLPRTKMLVKTSEGDKAYTNYSDLEGDYIAKKIHPLDLKESVAEGLIEILAPIRKYFQSKTDMLECFNR